MFYISGYLFTLLLLVIKKIQENEYHLNEIIEYIFSLSTSSFDVN